MLRIDRQANSKVLDLLKENVIGTPGKGMLYSHTNIERKLSHIKDAYFASIQRPSYAVANICFVHRIIRNLDNYYIRYFTFRESIRRQNAHYRKQPKKRVGKLSPFLNVMEGKSFDQDPDKPSVIYSYIEPGNIRSIEMAESYEFEVVRTFTTHLFSRFWPKQSSNVRRINKDEVAAMREALRAQYEGYSFYTDDNIFIEDNYYVIEHENRIVAGLQAHPDEWHVYELPGVSGRLLLEIASRMPILKRIFSKNYRFLTIEGIFILEGYEGFLENLIEAVLAKKNFYTAMLPLDVDSKLNEIISKIDLGTLQKLYTPKEIGVVVKFNNMKDGQKTEFTERPAYISAFDIG